MRTFQEWWDSLPDSAKEAAPTYIGESKNPIKLETVNYIWLLGIMNKETDSATHPTPEEMFEWIRSGQVDAKRD